VSRRVLGIIAAILAVVSTASPLSAQNPPRDSRAAAPSGPPAPAGTGAIAGVVTADNGTQPIRFAAVVLLGATTGIVKVTSTDSDGRFSFVSLPVDRYIVGASKTPYLGAVAGAKRPARPGTPIALANGQKIGDVAIRLTMGAAISGTIVDEQGRPAADAMVTLQQWRMQQGERRLVGVAGTASADAQGAYRFYGLSPGEYFVASVRLGAPAARRPLSVSDVDAALSGKVVTPAPAPAPVQYPLTYFPGTPRVNDAQPVLLTAGEDRSGVDIRIAPVSLSRVEGVLIAPDGQAVGGGTVLMMSAGVLTTAVSMRTTPEGRFTAANQMPGPYVVFSTGQGPHAGHFAHQTLELSGADVTGVQLILRPTFTMTGRLVLETRGAKPPLQGRRPPMRLAGPGTLGRSAPNLSNTDEHGGFSIGNLAPGRYMFGGPLVTGPSAETMQWSLASVMLDGVDVTDRVVEITADAPPKHVVMTYSDRFQELTGRLQSQSGAPLSDYTIVVFPEDREYWLPNTRRIAVARPGTDGRFTLSGPGPTTLPPGKYLLAAVTDLARDEQFDPSFLAQLVPASVPISLRLGEKKVQDVAIK
jgi:hypothetical protein